ncbi:M48 family metalloprotease [Pseudocolwellia sp. HL-MZ7]|uniref:M48 family metalloprotease n=1 Tax=Pseudocolwellia sp. HL-MZ7 TaxID=3400627 RepID=UPI003CEA4ED5
MLKTKKLILSMGLSLALITIPTIAQNSKNKLPSIGAAGFSALSIDKEQLIGNAMMRQVRASQPILHDPVLIEYINSLGNLLVKNANDVNYAFDFFIINSKELNAFAFFGGHIGIHSGLITTASDESELASVIAHEISHVTQRHLARRLEEQTRNSIFINGRYCQWYITRLG